MRVEDDTRTFWVFTYECGCTTGVLTNDNYGRTKAFREMYDGIKAGTDAIDRGVTAELVDAAAYHGKFAEMISRGHTCRN